MDSILNTIKTQLGITEDYTPFDAELILHINTVFRILNQLGCGVSGYEVTDVNSKWSEFLGDYEGDLSTVKTYVFLKIKQFWDPAQIGSQNEAISEMVKELEFRIGCFCDPPETVDEFPNNPDFDGD